jgi:hypothetical protein
MPHEFQQDKGLGALDAYLGHLVGNADAIGGAHARVDAALDLPISRAGFAELSDAEAELGRLTG